MSTDPAAHAASVWSEITGPPAAPLLVLVHGSMDRSAGLLRLSRRLDDRFRVVRYDRRGYGRSVALDGPHDLAAHVADLAEVVESARQGDAGPGHEHRDGRGADVRATVFGHSYGGNVALALAAARPDLVGRVVVYESPLSWVDWWPGSTAGGTALGHDDPADAAEAFMRRLVGDHKWERLPPGTRRARRAEGAAMVAELADLRRGAAWDPELVRVPVVAMVGERAQPHHRRAMEFVADTVADARLVVVEGAGHVGPNTHADAIAAAVAEFAG